MLLLLTLSNSCGSLFICLFTFRSAPARKPEVAKVTGTRDVVVSQLRHLQGKNDKLNEELAQVSSCLLIEIEAFGR